MFLLYTIVLALGIATIHSDIKIKKIRNNHLLIATISGIIVYIYLIAAGKFFPDIHFLWNALIALFLAMTLYLTETWGGGDAKLFIVLCFLIPLNRYPPALFFPSIALFVNIFLFGTIAILILLLKNTLKNRKTVWNKIFSNTTALVIGKAFLIIFSLNWAIQPVARRFLPEASPFLFGIILFLAYRSIFQAINRLKNNRLLIILISIGLISRLSLYPLETNIANLISAFKRTAIYTFIFYNIQIILEINKQADSPSTRIPFAPFHVHGSLVSTHGNT